MRLFTTIAGMRCYLERQKPGKEVGLVPTMGALHKGHLSLIQRTRNENDIVIVSIFVNPLQFGPAEDFQQYPRQLDRDRELCQQAGVDAIFAPTAVEMGMSSDRDSFHLDSPPFSLTQVVPPKEMTSVLCAIERPGHFQGIATVVTQLFNIIQPTRAYFGQKDAQQVAIVRRLVADLNLPVQVVACPIVREASGLALSSRNQYLTSEQKEQAAVLYRGLQQAQKVFQSGTRDRASLIEAVKTELALVADLKIEYIEINNPITLKPLEKVDSEGLLALAARLGKTRLIDNVLLQNRQPIIAIDGPAGAGKSTVARKVAKALGLLYLDTGAMYRAVTWLVLQSGISVEDEPKIAESIEHSKIQLDTGDESVMPVRVWINNREVTQEIRTLEVTAKVSALAALPSVRRKLVRQQQTLGKQGGIVAEGRDIGTHVFPDAELKIFLTASLDSRARRRQQDLKNQGEGDVSLEQLSQTISSRDTNDSTRAVAPLEKAPDAIVIQTDNLSIAEVTQQIISLYSR